MLDWLLTLYTLRSKLSELAGRLVLLEKLDLRKKVNELSEAATALQAQIDRLNGIVAEMKTSQVNIAADIASIKAQLPTSGGLTAAEVATLSASLDALNVKASAVSSALSALDAETTTATA